MLICSSHKAGYLGRARAQPSRLLDCKEQLLASTLKMRCSDVVNGVENRRADTPATVRQPPSIARGRTMISLVYRYHHRPAATRCSGPGANPALRDAVSVFAYQYDRSGGSEAHHDRLYDHTVPSEGLACTGRPPTDISLHRERSDGASRAGHQQSGATSSSMLERPTGPSRDRREWLGEPGPSADNVRGHFTD